MRTATKTCLLSLVVALSACTVQETPAPPLMGPSEMALRINLQAIPDTIFQDGASQVVLNIEATGADGRPVRGLGLRVDITAGGVIMDFGTLSAKTVVTDDAGRARVTYTAPPRPAEPVDTGNVVTILVTPIGNDFRGQLARQVDIRLYPVGVILPPNDGPTASFTFTPTAPQVLTTVTFDASASTDEGVPCGSACSYQWDFGDNTTGTGIFITHQFRNAGAHQVRLTVTDSRGASNTSAQTIEVQGGTPPTAAFTFSPNPALAGQLINFNASASRAATGRRIVRYDWDFGSGRFDSGVQVTKGYETAGTYNVTLNVTDDAGNVGTVTQSVTVGAGGITASLVVSPSSGNTSTAFFFDASASRSLTATITEYCFDINADGVNEQCGAQSSALLRYGAPGTYTARVLIRDSANRIATATASVTVN
jgi:PKD repeat protein